MFGNHVDCAGLQYWTQRRVTVEEREKNDYEYMNGGGHWLGLAVAHWSEST